MSKINGIETEWTVLQRQHGNLPELPEEEEVDKVAYFKSAKEEFQNQYAGATLEQINELEQDSKYNEEEDDFLQQIKARRLLELKQKQMATKFGGVQEISATEYVKEVCQTPDKTTFVVVHLYAPAIEDCKILDDRLTKLSNKFLEVKFVRIRGSAAIPNFPEKNCPTLLIYRGGNNVAQFVGLGKIGGREMTANDLEWILSTIGVVKSEMKQPPSSRVAGNSGFKFTGDFSSTVGSTSTAARRSAFDYDEDDEDDDY
ncbi:predicted protein [Naegleria gruberi]|uniref:Predicted protein n=1 Tax=Naegleria gruberi TaxID=5762 RepID=D2V836_NAEGR|nr:uncharacterized protein NAEGRDRAFT_31887 [Naegleria gruberi]EFC47110.1 predicted protein [Naegleria gruberi]|eukprot:XP_002679854.1 predicted protein [Naegleria gruberi strain NEG-M]